jgi:hypothetical protein
LPFAVDPLIAEAKRRARRRRWLSLLAIVVLAVAAAATLELRSASGSGVAAAADGRPVTHVVIRELPSKVYFNLKTGRKTDKTLGEEMWSEPGRHGWHHIISTVGGRPAGDTVFRAQYTRPNTEAAAVDGFYAALATDFRAAFKSGKVQLVDRGTFDGRRVDWVRVVPRQDRRWYVLRSLGDVGVDARTYKPILLRGLTTQHYFYTRILAAKAIRYDPADFKRRGPKVPTAVPSRRQIPPGYALGSTNPSATHSTVVPAPWLTAGTTVAGLSLRAVRPFTIRHSKHRFRYGAPNPKPIHGLELVYGPAPGGPGKALPTQINLYGPQWEPAGTRYTTVYEVPRAPRVPPWSTVPAGSTEVQTGLTTVGNHVVHTMSVGYLSEHSLYITIRTPHGPRTALQIARSLRAAPR